jgi:phenylpyruvate tautomerase PptA (4-oxalocrotonate tautomerase family)
MMLLRRLHIEIINVKLTGPMFTYEQKEQLLSVLTDAFVSVLGEQVQPYTFVIGKETQGNEFSIASRSMPDLQWLVGNEYKVILRRAEQTTQEWIAQQTA